MHPYETLDKNSFWATAVASHNMFDIGGLWDPKFRVTRNHRVATFGSCFAQHFGRALDARGFNWLITEQAPAGLSEENARKFNYGVFTARTGNIYTVSLLKQWVGWAAGGAVPDEIWEKDGRYYDPFRPNIEPGGFASATEVTQSRQMAIEAFAKAISSANIFVFTLGLTESWFNKQRGYEYPMCPGTVAGDFDTGKHQFVNQSYSFIRKTLIEAIAGIRKINPKIRILLTVSPVPLTATMSGNHVLVATMESKSILRAAAGNVARKFAFVDYFPSYEIINGTPFRGTFFEANMRSVNRAGVEHVMSSFFNCLSRKFPFIEGAEQGAESQPEPGGAAPAAGRRQGRGQKANVAKGKRQDDVVCEEELLDAFGS